MSVTISPWTDQAEAPSPDRRSVARYGDAMEVAMGAPTMGTITVNRDGSDQIISAKAGASIVWSDDSAFLAFSEWTVSRKQQLHIYRVADGTTDRFEKIFRVIQLHEFSGGVVRGIDSPIHQTRAISISYNGRTRRWREEDSGSPAADPFGLDAGVTPTSPGGALLQAIGRLFRSR